jgi:CheY-like chemotaxis protein/two-component sensor histidine kinase
LQRENRRKDEFIALLAHELRNPLAPIRAGVDLMKLEPAPSRSMAKALTIMDRQLTHLVRLIDDLLDMSRINAGKLDLRMEGIAVIDVVNAALEASAAEIAAAGHTLELSLPDEDLHVQADAVRMTQVLNNLLNNAARYMPEGGHIHLAVRREDDMAVFEVSDQGIGIEAEMQPRVFDMFAQTEPGQALRKGGLGIGLPLARRLVQMHGGRITLRSAIGKGSSFTVSIPAQDRKREVASGPADAYLVQIQQANAVGKRILVLDDNVDAATMLGALLDAKGHLVTYAHTGSEAIALAGEFRPEIAFLDIGLPDMSGYEVARALRGMPELAQTKLVALTGWGGERDKEESRKAGIDLHLTKPARIEEMRALMPELG